MAVEHIERYQEPVTQYRDDVDAVLDSALTNLVNFKAHHTRRYVYEPNEEGFRRFQENTEKYFAWVKNTNAEREAGVKAICPDIEGWCVALGITRTSLHRYTHQRGAEWRNYIEFVREQVTACKKEFGYTGRVNPMYLVFDLVNNSGYYNTNSFSKPLEMRGSILKQGITLEELMKPSEIEHGSKTLTLLPNLEGKV